MASGLRVMGRAMQRGHLWVVVGALVVLSVLHYAEQLGLRGTAGPSTHFGLTRHAVDRLLFVLPIAYASFTLGFRWGMATLVASALIMLPRALFISPSRPDAILEVCVALLLGAVLSGLLEMRERERREHREALQKLESAHKQLQHYVMAARSNERRLTILNTISTEMAHLVGFQEIVQKAASMVAELLQAEIVLLYTLDRERQLLTLVGHEGVSEDFVHEMYHFSTGEGFVGRVAQTGEPLVVRGFSPGPRVVNPDVLRRCALSGR